MRRAFLDQLRAQAIVEAARDPQDVPDWLNRALANMTPEEIANILWLEAHGELEAGIQAAKAELGDTDLAVNPERALRFLADNIMDFATGMVDSERAGLRSLVADGVEQGWGATKLGGQIREFFRGGIHYVGDDGIVERTVNLKAWADMVSRTELSRAYNQGARSLYEQAGITERVWVTAGDAHECPQCEAADGEVVKIGALFPSVDVEDAPAHPNCCPAGTMIETSRGQMPIESIAVGDLVLTHRNRFRKVLALSPTQISEELFELRTKSKILRVTGNHPIYTGERWTPANALQPGDQVACVEMKTKAGSALQSHDVPAKIGKRSFFSLILRSLPRRVVPVSTVNFNGEHLVRESDVNPVYPNREVWVHVESSVVQATYDNRLVGRLDATLRRFRSAALRFTARFLAANSSVGRFGQTSAVAVGGSFPPGPLTFADVTPYQAEALPTIVNSFAAAPDRCGERKHRFTGKMPEMNGLEFGVCESAVRVAHIVIVSLQRATRLNLSVPVFNFQVEEDESYIADGIVVHNCFCTTMGSPEQIAIYKTPENAKRRAARLARNQAYSATHGGRMG